MSSSGPGASGGASAEAGAFDAVVVGGGMAGLTAAYAMTRRGLRPLVLEATDAVGGLVASGVVGGYEIDLGAEAFAVRRPEVADLAADLGLATEEPAEASWVWAADRPFRVPARSLLGIPADLTAPDVIAALGPEAATAAALRDSAMPASAHATMPASAHSATLDAPEIAEDLASLVRARMGEEVLRRLVAPVAGGIHSADPVDLAVDSVAPGLRAALAQQGTLSGAVAHLLSRSPSGPATASVTGGMFRLPRALADAITAAGGEVRTGARVTRLHRAVGAHPDRGAQDGAWELDVTGGRSLRTSRVVLATTQQPALDLLSGVADLPTAPTGTGSAITHATLVVRSTELNAAPRGAGLLVPPGVAGVRAKALTHVSAKWAWLGRMTGPGVHVLRVSYGRPGEDVSDVDAPVALSDAATLLGVPLDDGALVDSRLVSRTGVLAAATPAHRAWVDTATARLAELPGLVATGAWVAGTGLAAVVAHAIRIGSETVGNFE